MRLIIISGRSGSGKSTALHQLEDEGMYCIDNLPATLLPDLAEFFLSNEAKSGQDLAVSIDARDSSENLQDFPDLLNRLPAGVVAEVLYFDAEDSALIKRFSETRRRHPLSDSDTSLAEAIQREVALLNPIASNASLRIDTTGLTVHELRSTVSERVVSDSGNAMSIQIMSFGFKHGLPPDADLVFDLRMLPNPHWQRALRPLTGRDQQVIAFLRDQPEVEELFTDLCAYLDKWLPRYQQSTRRYISIALGCTGGQHRSVYLAERLYQHYRAAYPQVHLRHREL